jgi:hypothetical protein
MKFLIRKLLREIEEDQYYRISASEYVELMKLSGYHGNVTKLKKFGGKPLLIIGSVVLSNTPTDSLGNVAKIEGSLDISHTKVSDISGIEVKGHVWDSDTPIERKRIAAELREKLAEVEVRRSNSEWDLNSESIDDEGIRANALYQYLVDNGDIEELDEEEKERLSTLKIELDKLQDEYNNVEDPELVSDLYDRITDLEGDIEGLENENSDVYIISPLKWKNYGLSMFEVVGIPGLRNREYSVGDTDEMDKALDSYGYDYVRDVGIENFSEFILEDCIDKDYLSSYVRDWYEDDVQQNPEVYFNEDDFELTAEQEREKDLIEAEIEEYEVRQQNLDSEIEEPDEYSRMYDQIQDHIDSLQERLEEITPNTDEPTQDMVDRVVDERIDEATSEPIEFIKNYGLEIKNFVDLDDLAKYLVDSEGYELLNSYDGHVDNVSLDDETYYIMRVN